MSNEDYKALTVRLYATIAEVFRTGNSALLDPLLAPDMVDHAVPSDWSRAGQAADCDVRARLS